MIWVIGNLAALAAVWLLSRMSRRRRLALQAEATGRRPVVTPAAARPAARRPEPVTLPSRQEPRGALTQARSVPPSAQAT